jgi:hypothetical protein
MPHKLNQNAALWIIDKQTINKSRQYNLAADSSTNNVPLYPGLLLVNFDDVSFRVSLVA